ncbi:extensin-like [Neltuma alba]|uniref:extensin-like n=1 Tax=Neltuma alba TaxID=207710 RepID=UPI0010A37744|nr:extensin-like [Prosopis alba]
MARVKQPNVEREEGSEKQVQSSDTTPSSTRKRYRPKVREESSKKRGVLKIRESRAKEQPVPPQKSPHSKSKLLVVTEESKTESDDRASVPQKDKGKQPVVSTSKTQDEAESTTAPSHAPGPSFMERSLREMFQAELQEFEKRVYVTAREYGEVSDRNFEDLLRHPPSPPHHEPGPSTSPIPTSPISTSPPVPPTSSTPSPTLALITVPQPVPSLHIPSFSPLSHLPPLPIPLSIPPVSTPSSSPPDADKKRGKDSDA